MKDKYVFLMFSFLFLISCAKSKEACVFEYEYYINKIEKEHTSYTKSEWYSVNNKLDRVQSILARYEKKLTTDDKKRIKIAFNIYAKYRKDITLPFSEKDVASDGNEGNDKRTGQVISVDIVNDKIDEFKKITEQQQEIILQLQQLRQQIEKESSKIGTGDKEKTEQELLAKKLENELLMKVLQEKKAGRREIHGNIKVLVFPTNFKSHPFNMDYKHLQSKIENALNIIRTEAKKYAENMSVDYEFMRQNDGSYISLNSSTEALDRYKEYTRSFRNYDLISVVYALDISGRSYCGLRGRPGNSIANAVMWYKKDSGEHSAGTLAHELFHTLGADDLYYEEGIVPKEVEDNFHKLVGDSIMINSKETNGLDPINAWLIGWNDKPEPWYAWFVDRRKSIDVDW